MKKDIPVNVRIRPGTQQMLQLLSQFGYTWGTIFTKESDRPYSMKDCIFFAIKYNESCSLVNLVDSCLGHKWYLQKKSKVFRMRMNSDECKKFNDFFSDNTYDLDDVIYSLVFKIYLVVQNGRIVLHPCCTHHQKYIDEFIKLASTLGVTL